MPPRSRRVRLCAALLCAVIPVSIGVASCGQDSDRSNSDVAVASAVRVEAEGCHVGPAVGAGSFVAAGRILTVAHVVAGSTEVDVVLADGTEHLAIVVGIDRQKDLAVLSVKADVTPLKVATMRPGTRGTFVVWRQGEPVPMQFLARSVVDISAADIDHTGSNLRRGYQIDANISPGDSGSVLVANGAAVAIIFARSNAQPNHAWATDLAEATTLIARAGDTEVDTGGCP